MWPNLWKGVLYMHLILRHNFIYKWAIIPKISGQTQAELHSLEKLDACIRPLFTNSVTYCTVICTRNNQSVVSIVMAQQINNTVNLSVDVITLHILTSNWASPDTPRSKMWEPFTSPTVIVSMISAKNTSNKVITHCMMQQPFRKLGCVGLKFGPVLINDRHVLGL